MFVLEHLIDGCTCHGKTCGKCHKKQCCHAFVHDKRRSDGLYGHCRTCQQESRRAHHQEHPEDGRIWKHNYRARKHQADGTLTAQEWLDLKAQYGYQCVCCGKQEPDVILTADHIVPLARGGANEIANIQPLCFSCNRKKSAKTTDYRPRRSVPTRRAFS